MTLNTLIREVKRLEQALAESLIGPKRSPLSLRALREPSPDEEGRKE